MLKKKLLPAVIELVVILNHLGVIHLWQPQKMTNFMTPPSSHILCTTPCLDLQTWTIDLLFKNKKICRHVTNFKTNFWSLTCLLRMNCCLDTSPTGHFPNQDFPDWHIPDWTIPQPTLSQLGISLTRHLSEQLFPWLDVSPTGHFPERIFTRLHISPDTHFSFLYISFPSRHFLDAK